MGLMYQEGHTKESAFVSLWSSANISNAMFYEIALGAGHTAISLRRNKNSIYFDFVNGKWMSDTQFMPFWISWEKGVIEIGTSSELHNDTRKTWSDPNPLNISYAEIMTGWGQYGDWIIYPYTVEEAKCCSCSGREHTQTNISSKDASTKAKRLKKELMVNKESLSKFERRKICADDFRDSSKHMGYIGAIVLTLIVIFVCGLDCL
ncbi:unnamed protein product [Mytilus edulis]|uniref:Farnesoic acid O-methyl transferase domain-containing protein n=1 Tax=Mytilus edulis TaxID=6550 RepID=A0A8S3VAW9_MYTED|nr:unnamed protein product [Mytilus edulis]